MEYNYSVLMSVYFKEKKEYLEASIESMLSQTLKPEQIVLVKDGELTPELDSLIEWYRNKYPQIFTIVCIAQNVGLGEALNRGLRYVRNSFVARMDSDDISCCKRCELQINEFKNDKELDIVGTYVSEFIENPESISSIRVVPVMHEDIYQFSRRRNPFNHPSVMYKKEKVLALGGYPNRRRGQDFELFTKMIHSGCKGKNINQSLVLFRINSDSVKRKKNWDTAKNRIEISYEFWKSGICSTVDFLYVLIGQMIIYCSPTRVQIWLYKLFLRK